MIASLQDHSRGHQQSTMTDVTSDLATIARINAVPAILQVICETSGLLLEALGGETEESSTA